MNGTLYGTTTAGGKYGIRYGGFGTVFSITTGGKENVLHSFGKGSDSIEPSADLIDVKGTLYGTTQNGSAYGCGTVFSITTDGTETVLHSFGKGADGCFPFAGLVDVRGTLYGTTAYGGTYACYLGSSCGTVFSITLEGSEKVLHSFGNGTDGAEPQARLLGVNGTLYGTTVGGGKYGIKYGGDGTVFSITRSGTEKVLHSFGEGTDGNSPFAGLIDVDGTFFGTTSAGGAHDSCTSNSCGTVFSITQRLGEGAA